MRAIQIHESPTPSPSLLEVLKAHLPHSLPVLRQLQIVQNFPQYGKTPHGRVLHAHYDHDHDHDYDYDSEALGDHVAVAYVDLSVAPDTQVLVYSSLEDGERHETEPEAVIAAAAAAAAAAARGGGSSGGGGGGSGYARWAGRTERDEEALDLVVAVLRRIRAIAAAGAGTGDGAAEVLVGSLNESVRQGLLARGVRMRKSRNEPPGTAWEFCGKWLFRIGDLPLSAHHDPLPEGMRWDRVREQDVDVVLKRTIIKRKPETLLKLPSLAIRLDDGTAIAWGFMGLDGSVKTLHVEEAYRKKGLARALTCKLTRERVPDYGDDGWGAADVFVYNDKSKALFRSLGGKAHWIGTG
ncbi:uncharacterized protein P884DRAFT_327347 [Thermothelomyces heterothallicus CBS 202.75]|uniref:uncharacterized protein n=1 Tax=Thermothelomyces heterothallicus CBS 202.75 TaxID=1149848 RepID=UPI003743BA8D